MFDDLVKSFKKDTSPPHSEEDSSSRPVVDSGLLETLKEQGYTKKSPSRKSTPRKPSPPKKKTSTSKLTVHAAKESTLINAIRDLENEIKRLSKQKSTLYSSIQNISGSMKNARKLEQDYQEKIARLVEEEAKLHAKKENLRTQLEKVSDKLGKISKIKSEMSDV